MPRQTLPLQWSPYHAKTGQHACSAAGRGDELVTKRGSQLQCRKTRCIQGEDGSGRKRYAMPLCCTDQQPCAVSPPQRHLWEANVLRPPEFEHAVQRGDGNGPSVICSPSVRERSASPITRL